MPATLTTRDITVSLGPRLILDGISITLDPGHRIGLIGPNGTGKSTLLRVMAGLMAADEGSVRLSPPTATVGYLQQETERTDETVQQFLARRTGVAASTEELESATEALAAGAPGADDRYSDALDRWLGHGAADFDTRVGETWAELNLDAQLLQQPMSTLSGGEAARTGLAAVLLAQFDVLLLDEPTNDLDLESLERLERFLLETNRPLAIVSHDREFLRRAVTDIVELDEFTHQATTFSGGFESYLRERELVRQHAREAFEEYDAKRSSLAGRAQREREWASQGLSKATKRPSDNDKNIRSFKIDQTEQLAGKAARTQKMMERLDVVEEPREAWQLRLVIPTTERSGNLVARLDHAVIRRGNFTLGPVSIEINAGDRVVIVGPNGSGKSTLIAALLGEITVDEGQQRLGSSLRVGRIEQTRLQLTGEGTVIESFLAATGMTVSEARTLIAKFGIGATHVNRPTATLSPGERTRLVLALLMAQGCNCLVLDEPTNHLDLPAIEQLEQAVDTFAGTVLLVTHDRQLLANVRRTRTIVMDNGALCERTNDVSL